MKILEIILIGFSLAMDSFAVSVCKGFSMKKFDLKKSIVIALYFGFFQALMPLLGYFLGVNFTSLIESIDHWIAFILLLFIGGNMIKESFEGSVDNDEVSFKAMISLAIATSIDALVIGVTFAFLKVNIFVASFCIGLLTFLICLMGVFLGEKMGDKIGNKSNILGGILLILIGTKILLEHLGLI